MPPVRIVSSDIAYQGWSKVRRLVIDHDRSDGETARLVREVIDFGSGAAVLPYDPGRSTVLLVRQFRLPPFLADGRDGMIEACAGLLDGLPPEEAARKEAEEELGLRLATLTHVASPWSSPGAIAERMYLFVAPYSPADRIGEGGGHAHEGEDIEVIEMPFRDAFALIASGGLVDTKAILLLQHLALSGRMRP